MQVVLKRHREEDPGLIDLGFSVVCLFEDLGLPLLMLPTFLWYGLRLRLLNLGLGFNGHCNSNPDITDADSSDRNS